MNPGPSSAPASRVPAPADGPAPEWGVYTLANDAVLESVVALFESLAEFAPRLPVLVVPFDDRLERLAALAAHYGHGFFASDQLPRLDALGTRFYPQQPFHARGFRKLAAFAGPFRRFFFLDTDVVALSDLAELAAAIDRSDADLVYFDIDLDQVYRQGPLRRELEERCDARGFNAGAFASRRGALDPDRIDKALADLGEDWREQLIPNAEQPFLNLAADRLGLRKVAAHELVRDRCSTCWPAAGEFVDRGDGYRLRSAQRWDDGWRLFLAHWAGFPRSPEMPNFRVFERFRSRAAARPEVGRLLR